MSSDQIFNSSEFTRPQLTTLILLRLIIGYHFLFEGVDKLLNPFWSSAGFLLQSSGPFSGFFQSLATNSMILGLIDFLNIWGQIVIGLGLILGLFSNTAAFSGALLLLLYYISNPPFVENYLFVDKNLLEMFGLLVIALFPTSHIIGMERLIKIIRSSKNG